MKQTILAMALLVSFNAMAVQNNQQPSNDTNIGVVAGASASAGALALSGSSSQATGGTALGGSASTGGVSVDNDTRMPASPAISPSVGTANDCQIATPSSKAFSVLIFSVSGTTGVNYNDICFAYKMGQFDVAEKMMCKQSAGYRESNPACK